MTIFSMGVPTLSRGAADRSEDVRDPARIRQTWPSARVLVVDKAGRAARSVGGPGRSSRRRRARAR